MQPTPHGFFLEIQGSGYVPYPHRLYQPLVIAVDEVPVGTLLLRGEQILAALCPPHRGGAVRITLTHTEAIRPADVSESQDQRMLSVCVHRIRLLTLLEPLILSKRHSYAQWDEAQDTAEQAEQLAGLAVRDMLKRYETIAGNCDLGLIQVANDVDNLGLLRFGGATIGLATRLLDTEFEGVGDKIEIEAAGDGNDEWMIQDAIGLRFHTHKRTSVSPDEVLIDGRRMIQFLKRKILEDLRSKPDKAFVFGDWSDQPLEATLPLFLALRRYGEHEMLWVQHAPSGAPTATEVMPGLIHARLNTSIKPILGRVPAGGWLAALANVEALKRSPLTTPS